MIEREMRGFSEEGASFSRIQRNNKENLHDDERAREE